MPTPKLITIREAADFYGCSERSVRRYIAAGKLAAFRVGPRNIRVRSDDVEALLHAVPTA